MIEWSEINNLSLSELETLAESIFRKANYRIARLKNRRLESEAYKKLLAFIGSPYIDEGDYYIAFKIPETVDKVQKMNQIKQAIRIADKFLFSATSTITGIELVNRNRRKWVRANFDGFSKNKDADEFLRFFGSKTIQEQKKIYDSNVIVTALAVATKNQPNKKIEEIYDDFKKSGKSWGAFTIEQEQEWKKKKGIKF